MGSERSVPNLLDLDPVIEMIPVVVSTGSGFKPQWGGPFCLGFECSLHVHEGFFPKKKTPAAALVLDTRQSPWSRSCGCTVAALLFLVSGIAADTR